MASHSGPLLKTLGVWIIRDTGWGGGIGELSVLGNRFKSIQISLDKMSLTNKEKFFFKKGTKEAYYVDSST